MTEMPNGSAPLPRGESQVRLRINVYDALAAAKGFKTVESQAELHGVNRTTMFRLRSGDRTPRLDLAMRIASDLGTDVEALWELVS